ncbi:Zn(II)2Cys6 transcription factor [Rhodotorula paludigena]|uniref:Zn(II)2Cys6 transcription factor n=1 Tax=Rhodotorula paludigena TaxID=86838 RepID=UPI0031794A3B
MADAADLYQQLFGAGAAPPVSDLEPSSYFDFSLPAEPLATASLYGSEPPLSAAHTRDGSGRGPASGAAPSGTIAPADLSPGVSLAGSSSRRRGSGGGKDADAASLDGSSAGSEKSARTAREASNGANGKRQKKGGAEKKDDDEDDEGAQAGGKKVKKTRNRKPSSCAQCRKKKLRCNRADPCAPCVARGEGHLCSWEGAEPLYKARDEADTQELRDQVARLESLVRYLTSQRQEDTSPAVTYEDGGSPGAASVDNFPSKSKTTRQGSNGSHNMPAMTPQQAFAMELRANDLCEGLAQLAIKEFVVVEGSGTDAWAPGNARGLDFVNEAKDFVETMPQQFGVGQSPAFSAPTPTNSGGSRRSTVSDAGASPATSASAASPLSPSGLGTASFTKEPLPLADVLKFLPTRKQAMSAYTYFAGYVSWYAHPVHLASFEAQWKQLDEALKIEDEELRNRSIDPFFISTFLGVLATGLAMMPAKRAVRDGFGNDKDKIVDSWLEGAMVALTCGRFLDNPSIEAVRAAVVLGTFFVFVSTGERSGAGMGLLSLVVQIALSLGLHRDPDRSPGRMTFFEAEERRRLFWSLFSLCILSSASLSRTWAIFDLNGVDTRLPLDCTDDEILDEAAAMAGLEKRRMRFEETPMTSLIVKMKLAVLARKMNDRAFGIHPVPYEEILALDAELREFEESIPARYQLRLDASGALARPSPHVTVTEMRACMVQISLAGEFLRLHRPWMLLTGSDKRYVYSRNQAIKYAKLLLAVYRSPSCNGQKWGGLSYKATNAAIVLAVDILAHPDGSEVSQMRAIVNAVCKQMEAQAPFSSLCRKGSRVLRFLLEKEAILSAQRDQRRLTKRVRTDDSPGVSFPSRQLRTALDAAYVHEPSFMHDREEEPLTHKGDHRSRPDDYFSAVPVHSYPTQQEVERQASGLPAFRPPPLPLPRQPKAAPAAAPVPAPGPAPMSVGEVPGFVDLASAFEFDFRIPAGAVPYASPAPTTYSSYPSPYGNPPLYPQPPLYSSQPPSQSSTPAYPVSAAPAGQLRYPPTGQSGEKATMYAGPPGSADASFVLSRY